MKQNRRRRGWDAFQLSCHGMTIDGSNAIIVDFMPNSLRTSDHIFQVGLREFTPTIIPGLQ
jgi:hypothetical protein